MLGLHGSPHFMHISPLTLPIRSSLKRSSSSFSLNGARKVMRRKMGSIDNSSFDYIVVGAGVAGSAVASRIAEHQPNRSVLLIEAGPDPSDNPLVPSPLTAPKLRGGELDWKYETIPQKQLGGRAVDEAAGRALGGGSVINFGLWTRGDKKDYDTWAELAGNKKWTYGGLLPWFKKSERHFDSSLSPEQHGYDGPVSLVSPQSTDRDYPLRAPLQAAWESLGVAKISDVLTGKPLGMADCIECRADGKRVISAQAYGLKGVQVLLDSLVSRVVVERKGSHDFATGVQLADGTVKCARREVILSAGAIHTPKILLMSGIGPAAELEQLGIPVVTDSPHVGKNLHNHLNVKQFWTLRKPERGLALGHPKFMKPQFAGANPADFTICQSVPKDGLRKALQTDEGKAAEDHSLLRGQRSHVETFAQYAAINKANPEIQLDGTHIQSVVVHMLPTSRGSVTLKSTDPLDMPVIDSRAYSTEADRCMVRYGVRRVQALFQDTAPGRDIVVSEAKAEELPVLSSKSTDKEIDERVFATAQSTSHPAGTAALGTVVNADLEVKGINCLRVCDASFFPAPVAAHPMACLYAAAERLAAEID